MPPRGNVRVRIDADDNTKKGIDSARSHVRTGFLSIAKDGAALGAGFFAASTGIEATKDLLFGSVEAAGEAEASQKKLISQLHATNASYRAHADEIDKVIQKVSQLAGLDDEDLQDAFTNLVRSTDSVTESMRLLPGVADLARAKNLDVAKAGEIVGKVYNGNVGVLKRYGISFDPITAAQDKLKASTKHATDQQVEAAKVADKQATAHKALGLLQQRFAGQAENYGRTQKGAADRVSVAWENLQETLGAKLSPQLTKAFNAIATFVTGMQDGTGAGGRFEKQLEDVVHDLKPYAQWLGNAAKNVAEFAAEHKGLRNVVAALVAVGAGIKALKFVSAITGFNNIIKVGTGVAKRLVPIFAKQGALAGAAAGEAAAGSEGLLSAKGKMSRSGNLLGSAFGKALKAGAGVYIASVIADLAGIEDADPLLFLHPPAAGWDTNTEKDKLKDAQQNMDQGLNPDGSIPAPNITNKPQTRRSFAAGGSGAATFASGFSGGPVGHAATSSRPSAKASAAKTGSKAWPPGMYSQADLEALWAAANPGNGDPALMAAIGMAESGGNSSIVNSIGAGGLWQIHPPEANYLDPWTNAKIAGRKLRTQGLGAWEAYTGPDGRGSDGPYRGYLGKGGDKSSISRRGGKAKKTQSTTIVSSVGSAGGVEGVSGIDDSGQGIDAPEFTPTVHEPIDWAGGIADFLSARQVAAELTAPDDDDIATATAAINYWQKFYDSAVKSGNTADQISWGGQLQGAKDRLDQLNGQREQRRRQTEEDQISVGQVGASLTEGRADDRAAAGQAVNYYTEKYNAAVASGNVQDQIDYGGKLRGARDQLESYTGTEEDRLNADIVKAKFTPDGADDAEAQAKLKEYYQSQYDKAVADDDPLGIIEWGNKLSQALADNTAALQQQNDLLKQQTDAANRLASVAQAETGSLGRAFLDWMSGELGGRIGPGFQTPAAAGVTASY